MKSSITVTEASRALDRFRRRVSEPSDLALARRLHEQFLVSALFMCLFTIVQLRGWSESWIISVIFFLVCLILTTYAGWQAWTFSRIRRLFEDSAPQNLDDLPR